MFNDLSTPLSILQTRRSGKPRAMVAPGPDDAQLRAILSVGMRTPDHGKLAPWRFIIVPQDRRDAFETVLAEATARAAPESVSGEKVRIDIAANREFAQQAPTLIVVLSKPVREAKIPVWEQELSAGAACMNIGHAAHALGFVAGWLTGWPSYDSHVRDAFGGPDEKIAGFIFIGTAGAVLEERPRPAYDDIVSVW
ncbi:MAG: nitroreductase [Sphingobium sp.]